MILHFAELEWPSSSGTKTATSTPYSSTAKSTTSAPTRSDARRLTGSGDLVGIALRSAHHESQKNPPCSYLA
jgi:hypothetical protein